jgi:hypothetical protein
VDQQPEAERTLILEPLQVLLVQEMILRRVGLGLIGARLPFLVGITLTH